MSESVQKSAWPSSDIRNLWVFRKAIFLSAAGFAVIGLVYGELRQDIFLAEASILIERNAPSAAAPETLYAAFLPRNSPPGYVDQHIGLIRSNETLHKSQLLLECGKLLLSPAYASEPRTSAQKDNSGAIPEKNPEEKSGPIGQPDELSTLRIPESPFEPMPDNIDIRISSKSYRSDAPSSDLPPPNVTQILQIEDISPSPPPALEEACLTDRQGSPQPAPQPDVRHLTVSEVPKGSAILKLTYSGSTPEQATASLEAIIGAYLHLSTDLVRLRAGRDIATIENQLAELRAFFRTASLHVPSARAAGQFPAPGLPATDAVGTSGAGATRDNVQPPAASADPGGAEPGLAPARSGDSARDLGIEEAGLLATEIEVSQTLYADLLRLRHQLSLVAASGVTNVRLVDRAWSDGRTTSISTAMLMFLFAISGLIVGSAFALVLAVFRRTDSSAR